MVDVSGSCFTLSRQYSCTSYVYVRFIQILHGYGSSLMFLFHFVKAAQLYITCAHQNHPNRRRTWLILHIPVSFCQGSTVVHHMCTSEPSKPYMDTVDLSCSCFTLSRQYSCTSYVYVRFIQILDRYGWCLRFLLYIVKAVQLYIICVREIHPNPR
jgi:hypothetical protein